MAADWYREIVTVEIVTTEIVTTALFPNMAFGPIGRCVGMSCWALTTVVSVIVSHPRPLTSDSVHTWVARGATGGQQERVVSTGAGEVDPELGPAIGKRLQHQEQIIQVVQGEIVIVKKEMERLHKVLHNTVRALPT